MERGRSVRRETCMGTLTAMGAVLTMSGRIREGMACVERALDDYQRALDDVLERNRQLWGASGDVPRADELSEDDWLTWDCCRGRIDATVETCRNLGFEASRDGDGSWRVGLGFGWSNRTRQG